MTESAKMKLKRLFAVSACLAVGMNCLAQQNIIEKANQLELKGSFQEAAGVLTNALADQTFPVAQRNQLEFELDRLERIRKDFSLTKEELFAELTKSVNDLTTSEFEQWIA